MASSNTNNLNVVVPPTVTSTSPANNTVNIATNSIVKINFNQSIKLATNSWIEFKNASGTTKPFTTTITGNTLNITPTTALQMPPNIQSLYIQTPLQTQQEHQD
ncbi:Ig-like domain-containing protein [Methanobacterium spitsbergense]|uniref:Ig-like domain-containing protein n=1 Tax=Methanobacterium spitsbergense TaxID=2874285 RepID=A0A8T5UYR4_9EURY|nr:Ig-like domain-containing protein [Methanobacterium spitsbergense]MBZ2167066.1 Ig-like domain-containing protein [Methanobacterium spitsbergense]